MKWDTVIFYIISRSHESIRGGFISPIYYLIVSIHKI